MHTGTLLSFAHTGVRCSYFSDGGTMQKNCDDEQAKQTDCVPGCGEFKTHAPY